MTLKLLTQLKSASFVNSLNSQGNNFDKSLTFASRLEVLHDEPESMCHNIYESEDFTVESEETILANLESDPPEK